MKSAKIAWSIAALLLVAFFIKSLQTENLKIALAETQKESDTWRDVVKEDRYAVQVLGDKYCALVVKNGGPIYAYFQDMFPKKYKHLKAQFSCVDKDGKEIPIFHTTDNMDSESEKMLLRR